VVRRLAAAICVLAISLVGGEASGEIQRAPSADHSRQKLVEQLQKLGWKDLMSPSSIVIRADSSDTLASKAVFVWFKLHMNEAHSIDSGQIAYCSALDSFWIPRAWSHVDGRKFEAPDQFWFKTGWKWFLVPFLPAEVPEDSDIVPESEWPLMETVYPQMLSSKAPEYPLFCKNRGDQGELWVKSLIDTLGVPLASLVLKSSENGVLDNSAVAASFRNRYQPAECDGHTTPVWVSYKVKFALSK
jgi:TonB family protein